MAKRKAVSPRTRFEVFKRDGFACQYCGRTPPDVVLHVDHVLAVVLGGESDQANLLTSCAECNQGKSDVPLGQVHRPLAAQMEEARERAEQVRAYEIFLQEMRAAQDREVERLGIYWYNKLTRKPDQYVFGPNRVPSIRQFLQRLAPARIVEAMDIAESRIYGATRRDDRKRWRYFCGVCWNMIRSPKVS